VSVLIVVVEPKSPSDFRIKEVGKGTPVNDDSVFRASDSFRELTARIRRAVPDSFEAFRALFTVELIP
jgi:hypothetical protein